MTIICVPYKVSKILRSLKCHHLQTTKHLQEYSLNQNIQRRHILFVSYLALNEIQQPRWKHNLISPKKAVYYTQSQETSSKSSGVQVRLSFVCLLVFDQGIICYDKQIHIYICIFYGLLYNLLKLMSQ